MKNIFLALLIIISSSVLANSNFITDNSLSVIHTPDEPPEFPGGQAQFMEFVRENYITPEVAKANGISGKIWYSFVITKTGEVANIKIIKGLCDSCDAEAVRVLNAMPIWQPGLQHGQPVNVMLRGMLKV
ncbi:MAG: energy transducer TonB [Bacteroidetes bacterium]|nr:energy transducer TonB [Bacteroidota bacterium]